jgi:hypothetical protein
MTKPVEEVIPRKLPENVEQQLAKFAIILEEVVNFGSNVVDWDKFPKIDGDHNITPTMLFRHFLDLIDAISVLVYKGSGDSMKLQARAALEVMFYIEYLFEKDTIDRSMAFLVEDAVRLIRATKKLIPNNEAGKAQHKKFEDESVLKSFRELKDFTELEKFVESKEKLLSMPQYKKAYEELKRLESIGEKNPKWYRYFNGPKNIEQLAKYLKQSTMYDIIYRNWSGSVHGTDIYLGKLSTDGKGKTYITQIRFAKDVQDIVLWSMLSSINVFRTYTVNRIPEKINHLVKWYQEQMPIIDKLQERQWLVFK